MQRSTCKALQLMRSSFCSRQLTWGMSASFLTFEQRDSASDVRPPCTAGRSTPSAEAAQGTMQRGR